MLPRTALGEVEDHRFGLVDARRAVASQVRAMGFAIPQIHRFEHRHRRLVGVRHLVLQQFCRLRAALANPLR